MILTCPACDTKYVVKDGAIPPGGRQVRCAACKHSWHEDGDQPAIEQAQDDVMASAEMPRPPVAEGAAAAPVADEAERAPVDDEPAYERDEQSAGDYSESPIEEVQASGKPTPEAAEQPSSNYGLTAPAMSFAPNVPEVEAVVEPEPATEWNEPQDDFAISGFDEEEQRPRGGALKILLSLLLLVALATAAFWFLAPPGLKARVGLAGADGTPLKVMLTTSDRQKLSSGNDLLAISGRVINPTDEEQSVPPIQASLRVKATRKLVYQWTIAPPARSLPPGGSASFNSAEVGIPDIGDELSLSLGGARS